MLDRTDTIRRTLPADLSAADEDRFWQALDQLRSDYAALAERRKAKPPMAELKRWQGIDKLADRLGKKLDDQAAVAAIKAKAADHIVFNECIVKTSKGHRSLAHWFLYPAVLDLWRVQLQQPLKYSRSDAGVYGELIDFFLAVVRPMVGAKTPKPAGIAGMIDRERERLAARKPGYTNSSVEK
jgi:hypothetical protein